MEDRQQYISRRIAEEIRESRRVIMPWIDEMARLSAVTLQAGVMTENGEFISEPPPPAPPALQEFCDRETERLKARVEALQAGQVFSLQGNPKGAMGD